MFCLMSTVVNCYNASASALSITFSFFTSICPILKNPISQESIQVFFLIWHNNIHWRMNRLDVGCQKGQRSLWPYNFFIFCSSIIYMLIMTISNKFKAFDREAGNSDYWYSFSQVKSTCTLTYLKHLMNCPPALRKRGTSWALRQQGTLLGWLVPVSKAAGVKGITFSHLPCLSSILPSWRSYARLWAQSEATWILKAPEHVVGVGWWQCH